VHDSFKTIAAVVTFDFSLSLCLSISQFTFISDFLAEELDNPMSTGHSIEVSIIEEVVGDIEDSFSIRVTFLAPFSHIVLIVELVLHHFVLLEDLSEFLIDLSIPVDYLSSLI